MTTKLEKIKTLAETDQKTAKQELYDYALETKGISLKRNKSFVNMLKDYENAGIVINTSDLNKSLEVSELQETGVEPEELPEDFSKLKELGVLEKNKSKNIFNSPYAGALVEHPTKEENTIESVESDEVVKPKPNKKYIETLSEGEYISLPYWIYDWIKSTKDWKNKKCPYFGSESFMEKILHNIKVHGSVLIRETRNSSFITLE